MNKDTIDGTVKEIGGKARSVIGQVTGNKEGEAHGKIDEAQGKMQKNYGKVKDILKDAVSD